MSKRHSDTSGSESQGEKRPRLLRIKARQEESSVDDEDQDQEYSDYEDYRGNGSDEEYSFDDSDTILSRQYYQMVNRFQSRSPESQEDSENDYENRAGDYEAHRELEAAKREFFLDNRADPDMPKLLRDLREDSFGFEDLNVGDLDQQLRDAVDEGDDIDEIVDGIGSDELSDLGEDLLEKLNLGERLSDRKFRQYCEALEVGEIGDDVDFDNLEDYQLGDLKNIYLKSILQGDFDSIKKAAIYHEAVAFATEVSDHRFFKTIHQVGIDYGLDVEKEDYRDDGDDADVSSNESEGDEEEEVPEAKDVEVPVAKVEDIPNAQTEERLQRIADSNRDYTDDDLNFLINSKVNGANVFRVSTAISAVPEQLKNSVIDFIASDDKDVCIAPIHDAEKNHFTLLYIKKMEAGGYKKVYIDPRGAADPLFNQEKLPYVTDVLVEAGIGGDIEISNTKLQAYDEFHPNNHCGPYIVELSRGLALDIIKVEDGRICQVNEDGDWQQLSDRTISQSQKDGNKLRKMDLELVVSEHLVNQIVEEEVDPVVDELVDDLAGAALSDSSPNSSDAEYGAKTLMRKIFNHVSDVEEKTHRINDEKAPTVELAEIEANPDKYYVANFRGDYMDYLGNGLARRKFVKKSVDNTVAGKSDSYDSIALQNITKKHAVGSDEYQAEIDKIAANAKVADVEGVVKGYKTPSQFPKVVKRISPEYGNPLLSTSKGTTVTPSYADHPKDGATLHPKYGHKTPKQPKHRLIGIMTVFAHRAAVYKDTPKADIEHLRYEDKVGKKSSQERENQEILFANEIASENVAGRFPMAYPNLSEEYKDEDKILFGLDRYGKPNLTKNNPKSLGKTAKDRSLYPLIDELQWKLAEKFVKQKNPEGELLWVDSQGRYRKFAKDHDIAILTAGGVVDDGDSDLPAQAAPSPKPQDASKLSDNTPIKDSLQNKLGISFFAAGSVVNLYYPRDKKGLAESLSKELLENGIIQKKHRSRKSKTHKDHYVVNVPEGKLQSLFELKNIELPQGDIFGAMKQELSADKGQSR